MDEGMGRSPSKGDPTLTAILAQLQPMGMGHSGGRELEGPPSSSVSPLLFLQRGTCHAQPPVTPELGLLERRYRASPCSA